ncbi:MAG: glycosyltransferase family 4 protein [Bacillota bacterium]|nr:glycosyltransferase family 4 protein [Bacillota bacterium]
MLVDANMVCYLSTFPPRRCGLATFVSNLMAGVEAAGWQSRVIAVSDHGGAYDYGRVVIGEIRQGHPADYRAAADFLNRAGCPVVNLHHEYGIFGGEHGETVLELVDRLQRPLVVTLHTVLSRPLPAQREIIRRLGERSAALLVMTETGRRLLGEVYGIDPSLVQVIPHGVPAVRAWSRREIRRRLGLAGRQVLCTFGLINPGKGIEYMLRALPGIVRRHPRVLYLVLGQTHPVVRKLYGESYRQHLAGLAADLGVSEHVCFLDSYLTEAELTDYLLAADVYVTPYLGEDQIVSGTLAYALGLGKAIVSTPYLHARELLAGNRGLLVEFRNANAIEHAVNRILGSFRLRRQLGQRAAALGMTMTWPRVGARYASLFREVTGRSKGYERVRQLTVPHLALGPPAAPDGLHRPHPARHLFPAGPGQRVHHRRQQPSPGTPDEGAKHVR